MSRFWLDSGAGGGSHSVYYGDDERLTVEWYDHGPDVPYESANMLIFDIEQQSRLADALGLGVGERTGTQLLAAIQARFRTKWEMQAFCERNDLKFTKKVDFWP